MKAMTRQTTGARKTTDSPAPTPLLHFRRSIAASLTAASLLLAPAPSPALADPTTESDAAAVAALASDLAKFSAQEGTTVFFGNGCFWGRQKDFIETERKVLGRTEAEISGLVGYAGGKGSASADDTVCYFYSDRKTVYEDKGHAEVVNLRLDKGREEEEIRAFAKTYFKQFRKTPFGYIRSDPQDIGAGYRNVIGVPGGFSSPLLKIVQQENTIGMKLVEGQGNAYVGGKATEDDKINTVYVIDSNAFPFFQAEQYHQLHNGLGKKFPAEYTVDLRRKLMDRGIVREIPGCVEVGRGM